MNDDKTNTTASLFQQVWEQYQSRLRGFLRRRVDDPDEVEDLLQEIMIRTYRNLDSVEDVEHLDGWIFRVAKNAVTDYYRRAAKSGDLTAENLWYDDEGDALRSALAQCIVPLIEALPEDSAALLMAVELNHVSQKDYAREHGLSYSTLKSRVQKGRRQLRQVYQRCCELSFDSGGRVIDCRVKPGGRVDC